MALRGFNPAVAARGAVNLSSPALRSFGGIAPRASGTIQITRDAAPMADELPAEVPTWAWVAGGVGVVGALGAVAWKVFGKKGKR